MKSKPLSHDKKHHKLLTYIGSHWYMKKMTKGLPPIRKQTLSKKAQNKNDKIKGKLHTANRNWNDWIFQLHWNKLDWVNPISKNSIKNPIQLLQKINIFKNHITAHWVSHSLPK